MTATMPKYRGDTIVHPAHTTLRPGAMIRAVAIVIMLALSSVAVVGAQESTPDATPSVEATPSPIMPRLELDLEEFNDSGIIGTVTLYDAGEQTIVEFDVDGAGGDHPAHVHEGVCGELNPEPAFNLDNIDEDGKSTTVVDATLDELLAEDYAIDMHLAPNELGTLIACADIDGEPELPVGSTPEASPESTPSDGTGGTQPTQAPTETPTEVPTEVPTETSTTTDVSDGTGGAIATATTESTDTSANETTTPAETETPSPEPTEVTTAGQTTASGQGDVSDVSDGTGGPGSTVPVTTGSTTTTTGDGTAGVSGKGEPVATSSLPQQAGVGAALDWPDNPTAALTWASSIAAIVLGTSAWMIRRGERTIMTTPSRWTRMGM